MITKCSSFNSILFYLPWLYTAIISARKLGLPVWAYPSAAALFTCLFGTCEPHTHANLYHLQFRILRTPI
eukprot:895174-Amorphochlora_amoeboformis.AAC.2